MSDQRKTNKAPYRKNTHGRSWLAHEVAKRAGFTFKDVSIIFQVMINIIYELIEKHESLLFTRLFKISVKQMRVHDHWDNVNKKYYGFKPYFRVNILPTDYLSKCANKKLPDKFYEKKEDDKLIASE